MTSDPRNFGQTPLALALIAVLFLAGCPGEKKETAPKEAAPQEVTPATLTADPEPLPAKPGRRREGAVVGAEGGAQTPPEPPATGAPPSGETTPAVNLEKVVDE